MQVSLQFRLNEKLYLKNPEESDLGRRILEKSIVLIHEMGFESFTFKKLANEISTVEASVYRYFENKHRLLLYIVDWYWSWQEYRLRFETNNILDSARKIAIAIEILSTPVEDDISTSYINESMLYEIIMAEGAKTYLTKQVKEDNALKLFKPYKDLCNFIADLFSEYSPQYQYPHSLSSTIVEMAHSQNFYQKYLPSLTDFENSREGTGISEFLKELVFSNLNLKLKS